MTPQQPPRPSSPRREEARRVDDATLKVNISAITVNNVCVTVKIQDGTRFAAMDSRLLRAVLGVSATPDPCILMDIRTFLLDQRGKRKNCLGVLVDKAGAPLASSLTYNARGRDIKVLPKAWPIYVEADDFEHLLNAVKDDAEARRRENRRPW